MAEEIEVGDIVTSDFIDFTGKHFVVTEIVPLYRMKRVDGEEGNFSSTQAILVTKTCHHRDIYNRDLFAQKIWVNDNEEYDARGSDGALIFPRFCPRCGESRDKAIK